MSIVFGIVIAFVYIGLGVLAGREDARNGKQALANAKQDERP